MGRIFHVVPQEVGVQARGASPAGKGRESSHAFCRKGATLQATCTRARLPNSSPPKNPHCDVLFRLAYDLEECAFVA